MRAVRPWLHIIPPLLCMGYQVDLSILNAAHYGVPQGRKVSEAGAPEDRPLPPCAGAVLCASQEFYCQHEPAPTFLFAHYILSSQLMHFSFLLPIPAEGVSAGCSLRTATPTPAAATVPQPLQEAKAA